jgi:predicted Ser/Thr protein kinase
MARCAQCSTELQGSERFCPSCGAPSGAGSASDTPSAATVAMPTSSSRSRAPSDPSSLGHGRFEPGTRLGTRWRIVGMLGRGGMGEVYRADDLDLGQSVALKFLPERVQHDASALARLRGEVRLARQIAHPNVARVYDIGEADGLAFITMEYVDGEDLASVLRRMGRPSRDKALEIARQLCVGLAAAHEHGVLHRDLKPSNVMIDGRGRVRIMDFGLAALADDAARGDEIVGTPAYMAPEQLAGGSVTTQSDIYSLGLVLYEIFTGRRAHEAADRAELARQHATGSISTPSSVVGDMDPVVERVLMRCLESDPRLRPATVYAVLGGLPGGDPLAAAIAAGETPSPDLVAHAGEAGGLTPPRAALAVAATLAVILLAILSGPRFYRPLVTPPSQLAYRATAILSSLGYEAPPRFTASGFAVRPEWFRRFASEHAPLDTLVSRGAGSLFYWRRYAPTPVTPSDIHRSVARLNDPPSAGAGSTCVMLDPRGHLLGLEVLAGAPHDTVTTTREADSLRSARRRAVDWAPLLAAAGIEPQRLSPDPRPWSPRVISDTTIAWTMPGRGPDAGTWEVRAAAYRGRVVSFEVADSLGSALPLLDRKPDPSDGMWNWFDALLNVGTIVGAGLLAWRNLALGRGDRRGAFRIAAFVFVATALETVFTWNVGERGLRGLFITLIDNRAFGHALMHSTVMWASYMALEPYVRRLWPRMLVSWARLSSGRLNDPLVGRDALLGILIGGASTSLLYGLLALNARVHSVDALRALGDSDLAGLGSMGGLGFAISYFASVSVLTVLSTLVIALLLRLVVPRDLPAIALTGLVIVGWNLAYTGFSKESFLDGTVVFATLGVVVGLFAIFRVSLLTALVAAFVSSVLTQAPPSFDPSTWYGARGLVVLLFVGAGLAHGAWVALAGQPLFADVLQERRPPR